MKLRRKIILTALALCLTLGSYPAVTKAASHPIGTNVLKNGTVYFIDNTNTRRPYTSAGAFLSYGFNSWESVVPATSEDLALPEGEFIPPQDGRVICADRGAEKGTCYLISGGRKAGFKSESDFRELGFSFNRALSGDVSFLGELPNITGGSDAHLPGTLIKDGYTIYLSTSDGLAGIGKYSTFLSWGYSADDAVPMNSADRARPLAGSIPDRTVGLLKPVPVYYPPPLLTVTSPDGGELWPIGTTQNITWNNISSESRVNIYLTPYQYPCYTQVCPLYAIRQYTLASAVPNNGSFSWKVGRDENGEDISEGAYLVRIQGSTQSTVTDQSDYPFAIVTPETEAQANDAKRLADVRQMASALELYYNDYNRYPFSLGDLSPLYISELPTAPTPADGSCTESQNTYGYTLVNSNSYRLTFCLGAEAGGVSVGPHTLSEQGIN